MCCKELGNTNEVKLLQLSKARVPIDVRFDGNSTSSKFEQLLKTAFPILLRFWGNTIFFNLEHP